MRGFAPGPPSVHDAESVMRDSALLVHCLALGFVLASCGELEPTDSARQPAGTEREEAQPAFPRRGARGGEGKLEPSLSLHLAKVPDGELVPVVLVLRRQVTAEEKARAFEGIQALERSERLEAQRLRLIDLLRKVAGAEQRTLLSLLEELEAAGQVRDVRPLWIADVIGVKASEETLRDLAGLDEVESIHLDLDRPTKGGVSWGVVKISADKVWSGTPAGYDGTGTIVAVLDTGVEYTHTSLAGRLWVNGLEDIDGDGKLTSADVNAIDEDANGYLNDVHGWDLDAKSHDPDDPAGHGTHVAGVVAGVDGTDSFGVAPGARVMALRESDDGTLSNQIECWEGMQYALAEGAHVVNFSSGWLDAWAPVYKTWREAVDNLMDGGVLFVTIVHNDYSMWGAPKNVRTPGRVPSALTVGATNASDAVPAFSNRGPVTWQAISPFFDHPWPPGLIKPDVVAPGVAIRSAQKGGGFIDQDGTSYAAPHASGLAALLRQKDPGITPGELKYLIEETAVDIPPAGPDHASGWGRIDAVAALSASIAPAPYELSVTKTSEEWTTDDIWVDNDDDGAPDMLRALGNNHLYARVRNLGGQVVTRVALKFYFADLSTVGMTSFDPDGDGDPSDGSFTYVGSYVVPLLGPSGSKHGEAVGLVNWNVPAPPGTHWCVGVGVVAAAGINAPETNTSNNRSFRNFVDMITPLGDLDFAIAPPPADPTQPFTFEIQAYDLPEGTRVELVFDRSVEHMLVRDVSGIVPLEDPLPRQKLVSDVFREALAGEVPWVRYAVREPRATLRKVVSPKGRPIPVRIVVDVPGGAEGMGRPRLVLSTIDGAGARVGGLTFALVPGTPSQKGGPFLPR